MVFDDAEQKTESWKLRHSPEARATLGVWRWKGMHCYMDAILGLCIGKRVIDFGGFDGPLGLGSIVVDPKGEFKTLDDVPGQVDVIFTSHTLEHCDDVRSVLGEFHRKLVFGGHVIVHVPSWTCKRWRATDYNNPNQAEAHQWTFAIKSDDSGMFAVNIDAIVEEHFSVIDARHCGDNSIMVIGEPHG